MCSTLLPLRMERRVVEGRGRTSRAGGHESPRQRQAACSVHCREKRPRLAAAYESRRLAGHETRSPFIQPCPLTPVKRGCRLAMAALEIIARSSKRCKVHPIRPSIGGASPDLRDLPSPPWGEGRRERSERVVRGCARPGVAPSPGAKAPPSPHRGEGHNPPQ